MVLNQTKGFSFHGKLAALAEYFAFLCRPLSVGIDCNLILRSKIYPLCLGRVGNNHGCWGLKSVSHWPECWKGLFQVVGD
jgi:hypothetical protein